MIKKLVLLIGFCSCFTQVMGEDIKRVFILASYEKEHVCGYPQELGILSGLSKQGWFKEMNLEVETYYMDTKRRNNTSSLMKDQAKIAMARITAFKPHVLVTIDDNAFREVGLNFAGDPNISVVFSGMNEQPEEYSQERFFMKNRQRPGANITGVYEKLYLIRSLEVMRRSAPEIKGTKYIGITDYSPTGNAVTKQFDIELQNKPAYIDWELRRVKNWKEYQTLIQEINQDDRIKAIYPAALSLKTESGEIYTAPEIYSWTIKHSKKPEMAVNYHFAKIGLFGGAAVDFQSMGFLAGKKAGQILSGRSVGEIPIEDAPDYAIVFNLVRARQLGINIPFPLLTAADDVYR